MEEENEFLEEEEICLSTPTNAKSKRQAFQKAKTFIGAEVSLAMFSLMLIFQ